MATNPTDSSNASVVNSSFLCFEAWRRVLTRFSFRIFHRFHSIYEFETLLADSSFA
jgi:hypothetical protein